MGYFNIHSVAKYRKEIEEGPVRDIFSKIQTEPVQIFSKKQKKKQMLVIAITSETTNAGQRPVPDAGMFTNYNGYRSEMTTQTT